ncbi:MAG: hypothetical protein AAF362_09905 [Pseudomonadota bacterium]
MRLLTALLALLIFVPDADAFIAADLPTKAPEDAEPLSGPEIRKLLGSGTRFDFVGVSASITGTGYWDLSTGTAYGSYELDQRIKGNWTIRWFIEGNLNCLGYSLAKKVCTHIYAHGDGGFLEVNLDGSVHTVYTPVRAQTLPVPISIKEAGELLTRFLTWNQQTAVRVGEITSQGDQLRAEIITDDGTVTEVFTIDAETGMTQMRSPNNQN